MDTNPLLESLQKKVQDDPLDVLAWEQLGDLYSELDDKEQAVQCYQKVLGLQPDHVAVLVNMQRMHLSPSRTSIGSDNDSVVAEVSEVLNPLRWFSGEMSVIYQVLIAMICFLITLILASAQQWSVTDLVWSLWITSLTLGYTYLVSSIVVSAIQQGMQQPEFRLPGKLSFLQRSEVRWSGAIIGALFSILFFTVHFGMFHFVHSIFLNSFFPLVAETKELFSNVLVFIKISLTRYWPVILLSLIAQFRNFQKITQNAGQNNLVQPYKNVVKMHVSILLFAGLSAANLSEIFMPYLLVLYFFPFVAVIAYFRGRRKKEPLLSV